MGARRFLGAAILLAIALLVVPLAAQSDKAGQQATAEASAPAAATAPPRAPAAPAPGGDAPVESESRGAEPPEPEAGAAPSGQDESSAGSATAAADAPQAAPATPASEPPMDGATYVVRLRDLEQRIDELKEQIRRSHTRLSLLSDTILAGGVGGARAQVVFGNQLTDAFRLEKLLVLLDGAVQYNKTDETGALADQEKIPIFSGSIPPGDHTVQILAKVRGHGYGVFSYMRGISFEIRDSKSFTITEGRTIDLDVVLFEKGGLTTPVEQRPAVRFAERVRTSMRDTTVTLKKQPGAKD